ncbi:RecQ family ATP-dependent DNA helicase [Bacillus pinisoli]|uniref:RecQ family ATP-dependent DNA helicase n=1 Tax=Bacillus pinisoli TaxID=2901866 RepID=UPI001FF6906A|nr:ATP-dependent DNA helicase RecQ [Bacillus pinisoli]
MELRNILHERFGYTSFRKGQQEIIEDVIAGRNVVAMLPTGAGKSICYLLPGYILDGAVIIVSPLLSLMEDQVHQLQMIGEKRSVAINSFLSFEEKKRVVEDLAKYKYIFVSPEMLQNSYFMNKLRRLHVSLFVIDEAHCISQWGHEFRTDYLKLSSVMKELGSPTCLALTATATKQVLKDIVGFLKLKDVHYHLHSIDRPNISINVEKVATIDDKKRKLIEWVQRLQGPGMIYFSSRWWAEHISSLLVEAGIKGVAYYHGGMDAEQRMLIQQQFLSDQLQIICCTNAFGMGVNKPNVRYVIHFHYPTTIEAYLQEIGRAGRDGLPSIGILLHSPSDQELPEALIQQEFPSKDELEHIVATIKNNVPLHQLIKEDELLAFSTINETGWRFIKYQLEIGGWLIEGRLVKDILPEEFLRHIKTLIEKRLVYKHQKLQEMSQWMHTSTTCRRQGYLSIFDEKLTKPVPQCCDLCKVDYQLYENKGETSEIKVKDWQQELKLILIK